MIQKNKLAQFQSIPLVLIHGWGMGSPFLKPLAEALSVLYKVYLIDLPGYGKNKDQSCPVGLEEVCQQLKVNLPQSCILIGWSMGGLIAQQMAILYPHYLKALIILNSSPCLLERENWPGISIDQLNKLESHILINPSYALQTFIRWHLIRSSLSLSLLNTCESVCPQALLRGLQWLKSIDLRMNERLISCPFLQILGKYDPLIPLSTLQGPYIYSSARSFIKVLESGHLSVLTHIFPCFLAIQKFINGLLFSKI